MLQSFEINCEDYKIVMEAYILKALQAAAAQEDIVAKTGEQRAAAIMEAAPKSGIRSIRTVTRLKNGKLNDGPDGELAHQRFDAAGIPVLSAHYKDGELNDGSNGVPAMQMFDDKGILSLAERYKSDQRSDGPNGELAVQQFSDGVLVSAESWKDGRLVKKLTAEEIASIVRSGLDGKNFPGQSPA